MKSVTHSCGLIVRNRAGQILMGHPTGYKKWYRSFPKGRVDKTDSSLFHTALREVYEETGYDFSHIPVAHFKPLKSVWNNKKTKQYHFWFLDIRNLEDSIEEEIDSFPFKCHSEFAPGKPEFDIVGWVYPGEFQLYQSQNELLDQIN